MSVLIKDMEIPLYCAECDWSICLYPNAYCKRVHKTSELLMATEKRPDFCPFIEIPTPHGRLIDADKLNIHDISPVDGFCVMGVTEEDIGLADTVIEAEGEDNA